MTFGRKWFAAAVWVVVAISATDGREPPQNGRSKYMYEETSPEPEVNYSRVRDHVNQSSDAFNVYRVVKPASYSFFSSNLHAPAGVRFHYEQPVQTQPRFLEREPPSVWEDPERPDVPIEADHSQRQTYVDVFAGGPPSQIHKEKPSAVRKTVQFPLNTVLPGNSLRFDHQPYPGLLQAVNTFSDLTPSRKPQEGVMVTHNTVSLPATNHGVTTSSRTRIFNNPGHNERPNYPFRDFMETTHNTKGDKGSVLERMQRFRVHQGLDGDPAESFASFRTGHGGGGKKQYESENGQADEVFRGTSRGTKGEKGYKKDSKHHKTAKGHHDKEQDTGDFQENVNEEKKYHKDEGFYGEHHKKEKGGKEKKYGEGGKHKKGHTTHGEHNVIKKDEFIKNTKFYDEDHGDGEHEERGVFYGQHEEQKGGNEKGKHKLDDYVKKNIDNKKHHDKGYVDEAHNGHETGSGHEHLYDHEEEYGGKKGQHTAKKWGFSDGQKY